MPIDAAEMAERMREAGAEFMAMAFEDGEGLMMHDY
jgi:hypothetical protein